MAAEPIVNVEELMNEDIDQEGVSKAEQELLLPVASYETKPGNKCNPSRYEAKGNPGDEGYKPARTVLGFFPYISATVVVTNSDGEKIEKVVSGRINLRLSPDLMKVRKDDGSEEYDRMSKNYIQARAAYKAASGEFPKTIGDLVNYLENYPVRLRVIQIGVGENAFGEPGNMVVGISAVRD